MSDIFFLVLRRLRAPLILLVIVYAIATLGMTLIPGVDNTGQPWHMSFFHAFYFVSFMGTTIGFGEIPYEFTDAQRAWVLVCIYVSVIAWLYAIGTVLSLVQDSTFRHAISNRAFERSIRRIDLPFYLICGYGETGRLVNRGLAEIGMRTVIIDYNEESTRSLELEDLPIMPIVLTADTTEPKNLVAAGINHPFCRGVVAVTENDHTNLQIAVSSKLMNRRIPVLCRSEIEDEADNMASFGTDVIINPYLTFARRLNMLTHNPALYRLHNWFVNQQSREHLTERPLPKGKWIICGYGRLGRAIKDHLACNEIEIVIVDPDPNIASDVEPVIAGRGTEAETLEEAGIHDATVIVAASDDDANNLSILITARELNPHLYTIGRVSKEANQLLFVQAECDYIMRRSQLVANEALTIISRPLVTRFIKYSNTLSIEETEGVIKQIETLTDRQNPVTWRLVLSRSEAPALHAHLEGGGSLTVRDLLRHRLFPDADSFPLLLLRNGVSHLLPDTGTELRRSDELLLCGRRHRPLLAQRLRDNSELIDTLINGNPHHIPLLRWLARGSNPA